MRVTRDGATTRFKKTGCEDEGAQVDGVKAYGNRSGNSGIKKFAHGSDWIRLQFASGDVYRYSAKGVGKKNLEEMKRLAEVGKGLTTFINTHPEVKNGYD